ncbi:hypothetical protein AVEN_127150-1 [Araneus ventricosus]|uniref:Uncharacterized protein n=1 Tax=Araneus ventricosus TaxID=182803 RepID=A0A4Y2IQ87_ARAVE|nr:hypothetical protein AVEN_127150-1 [Araneus ventricosus]
MNLQCTIAPDLFQCDQSSRGHCILYTTFSTAESNMSPGILSTVRNMLSFKVVNVGTPPRYILDFKKSHRKKSREVRSGENGHGECCVQDAMCKPREGWSH